MKRLISLLLVVLMVFSLAACGGNGADDDTGSDADVEDTGDDAEVPAASGDIQKIGISMPTKDLQRWTLDGENLKAELEAEGFEADLQFANNDVGEQVAQIENMLASGADVIVIAAIDGSALTTVLDGAKANGVIVISYDRLIMNSDAVSYYATFDLERVGEMQGQYIADALDLENTDETYNIEIFTGPTDDNNVNFFYGGAMKVLQPYIDDGTLVVPSGQVSLAETATNAWSTEEAQKRMENIISANYGDGTVLDAVLSSNDSVANGVTNAVVNGYPGDNFPIITGQDCETTAVKNIIRGQQSMSVFKDTRELAQAVVDMIVALANGEEPPVNDTETYDNGTGIIPSNLLDPIAVDIDNYEEVLIGSGYYTEDDLK
ncbi:MAG: substrate-binding domain-containing protein [Clostridiaceae bacterium]|nr:substrate-binding domain-containing protein [Clostridiaceae bacterium]